MRLFPFVLICLMFVAFPAQSQTTKINFDKPFTINKGDTITFRDGFSFVFNYHSHKETIDGEVILIADMSYILNDSIKTTHSIFHEELPFLWKWNKYLFTIISYKYDESMTMKIVSTSNSE